MRMFVALPIPRDVAGDLERFLEPRLDVDGPLRWIPPENWHITLAFLGDVPDDRLERVAEGLTGVGARTAPFDVRLDGAGAFPDVSRAKHLWAAVREPSGALDSLALHVRNACQQAGVVPDGQRFRPHLTLARCKPLDATRWLRVLDTHASEPWRVGEFSLYKSELGRGANGHARYEAEQTFALGG